MCRRTARSRSLSASIRLGLRFAQQQTPDDRRVNDRFSGGDPGQAVHQVRHVRHVVLEQVADAGGDDFEQLARIARFRRRWTARGCRLVGCRRRSRAAVVMPSSVKVRRHANVEDDDIRLIGIAGDGGQQAPVPDAALAVTWAPDASRSSVRLLRNRPESSAIASRMESAPPGECPAPAGLTTVTSPSKALTRSAMFERPRPSALRHRRRRRPRSPWSARNRRSGR